MSLRFKQPPLFLEIALLAALIPDLQSGRQIERMAGETFATTPVQEIVREHVVRSFHRLSIAVGVLDASRDFFWGAKSE